MERGESDIRRRWSLRVGRALRLVWESSPGWTLANSSLALVQGVLPLLTLYLLKLVLDAVSAPTENVTDAYGNVILLIAFMGLVALVATLAQTVGSIVRETHAQMVTQHMYSILHRKSVALDLDYYENPEYFDTFHRAQQEAAQRPTRILDELLQVCRSSIALVAIASLLLAFHWIVALVLFVAVVPGVLIRLLYSRTVFRWQQQRTATERQARYFDWLLTSPYSAKELRLFDLGGFFMRRFREVHGRLISERLRIASRRCGWESTIQVGATLAIFGSYAFVAYRAVLGQITVGDVAMFYHAFQRGQSFLRELLSGLAGLYEDNLFLVSLDEFLDLAPVVVAPAEPRPVPRPIDSGIVFEGVGFRYPSGQRDVLEGIDLTIGRGEMVALVGENGSGKTTLVKLLCRLYDPTAGRVLLDGIDLRDLEPAELRRTISVVFQQYGCYQLTAAENIWLGNTSLRADDPRIEEAARLSGAHGVIVDLKHGYRTNLGKWFEDGQELSVGEWQKVALARAYLRDAEIMILDEPTSALDPRAEYEVFRHLRDLAKDRSSLVISHRFSTVRMVDRIYVLNEGRIIESGSHEELLRAEGRYAELFEIQARNYR